MAWVAAGLPATRHQPCPDKAVHHAVLMDTPRWLRKSAMVLVPLQCFSRTQRSFRRIQPFQKHNMPGTQRKKPTDPPGSVGLKKDPSKRERPLLVALLIFLTNGRRRPPLYSKEFRAEILCLRSRNQPRTTRATSVRSITSPTMHAAVAPRARTPATTDSARSVCTLIRS